jgi:hypothetical protein
VSYYQGPGAYQDGPRPVWTPAVSVQGPSATKLIWSSVGVFVGYAATPFIVTAIVLAIALGSSMSVSTGLALKAVVIGLALVGMTAAVARVLHPALIVGLALAGYAVTPSTWVGITFVAQIWIEPGIVTILVDFVVWMLIVGATVLVRRATRARSGR